MKLNSDHNGIVKDYEIRDVIVHENHIGKNNSSHDLLIQSFVGHSSYLIFTFHGVEFLKDNSNGERVKVKYLRVINNHDMLTYINELMPTEEVSSAVKEDYSKKIKSGELTLIKFESSNGSDVAFICKDYEAEYALDK